MIQLQRFVQREKAQKEVVALLHQHLDARPASPNSPGPVAQGLLLLEALFFMFAFFVSALPFSILLGSPIGPSWLAPSPQIRLIGGGVLLVLAIAAFVLHLLLPIARPFFNYFFPLSMLVCVGSLVGSIDLSYTFLPLFGYPLKQNAVYVTMFAGLGVGMVLFFLFAAFTLRKDERVNRAQARADLLQTHLGLEQIMLTRKHLLKRLKEEKRQTSLEKATRSDIPRFYLARHPDGTYTVAFRHDLPIPVMLRLAVLPAKTAFTDHEAVQRILEEDAPCEDIWTGSIYTFPEETSAPLDAPYITSIVVPWNHGWEAGEQEGEEEEEEAEDEKKPKKSDAGEWDTTLLAYVVNEQIVAGCRAQKINEVAAEAWVQPEPSNGGEARQAALAWAAAMWRDGKIPYFSHYRDDEGAADLARGLKLSLVVEEVDYY